LQYNVNYKLFLQQLKILKIHCQNLTKFVKIVFSLKKVVKFDIFEYNLLKYKILGADAQSPLQIVCLY